MKKVVGLGLLCAFFLIIFANSSVVSGFSFDFIKNMTKPNSGINLNISILQDDANNKDIGFLEPYKGRIYVKNPATHIIHRRLFINDFGIHTIRLRPGKYQMETTSGKIEKCGMSFIVEPNKFSNIELICDKG